MFSSQKTLIFPASATVISGQSGDHWISLKFKAKGETVLCIYKGTGDEEKTKTCNNNGSAYEFDYCLTEKSFNAGDCKNNPFRLLCKRKKLDLLDGDLVDKVERVLLRVNSGDECDKSIPTTVEMILQDVF